MSLIAADGTMNVTVVDGETLVGRYAADGSMNVVDSTTEATPGVGLYHPSGAMRVTNAPTGSPVGLYAPNGSRYVTESPTAATGVQKITIISGSLAAAAPDLPNVTAVDVTGTPQVGQDLTGTPTTSGTGSNTYQWFRGVSAISGATNSTYTLTVSDAGSEVLVTATRHNASGGKSKNSDKLLIVADIILTWDVSYPDGAIAATTGSIDMATLTTSVNGNVTFSVVSSTEDRVTLNNQDHILFNATGAVAGSYDFTIRTSGPGNSSTYVDTEYTITVT